MLMEKEDRYVAKILFKNRVFQYKGQQFEDFFVAIMTKANSEFQAVKAYGKIGDQKNDGFIPSTGTYYQVFAPEDLKKRQTITDAVQKLERDFTGLYKNWNHICKLQKFYFVINDKYEGVSPKLTQKVLELGRNPLYSDISINLFTAKDLEKVFEKLEMSEIQDIVGFIPNVSSEIIEYDSLQEVITYLLNAELPESEDGKLIVPDFSEKIKFNNLSIQINTKLMTGSYQEGILKRYFNENPGINELLRGKFHAMYEKACEVISDDCENASDSRFYYILENSAPKKTIAIYTCVEVLMAYYFTTCDIFEEP